ncbi:f6aff818-4fb8-45e5-934a-b42e2cfd37da-CDS [Sclerotinia trifoliorum]|uniref:F6aff818-4fb8-45e5-934a-b42e2cfd37da-CDS n=1 Tax=Sclerotinia trifoliorum TaxID=28548 RepID=A0A8H2VZ83_9HELO|nr:f6aff818-4fb8-45e5-934a-b42e2cfd37da-CDS [Sclerotinia trifoliorum]
MTSYEYEYETVEEPRRHRSHHHRKDDREPRYADEPRYVETKETYIRSAATKSPVAYAPDAPIREREREREREVTQTRELVRQPRREDSDLSVEEVRRDFPPPAGGAYTDQRTTVREARYGPPARRSRSVGRDGRYGEYLSDSRGDPRRSFQEIDRRDDYYEDADIEDKRSLSRNQKIAAAVGGAALAVGAKELWDRRSAEGRPVERNPLASAMVGAAGALAAYEGTELYDKHGIKEKKVKKYAVHRGRNGEVQETYYSEEEEIKPEKKKGRRKSIVDSAMALAGLGAAAKGVEHHRGRRGSGDSYYEESTSRRSRSKSRSGEGTAKYQQAAKAALLAGAAEAFRVRNEPGAWGGEKGKRILTAAIGAGGIDAAIDKDGDKKSKRHILEAVVGGLVGNRAINGSRKDVEEDPVTGRSRSRSRARSRARSSSRGGGGGGTGLAALATAGLGAIAGKKLLDRSRSRSRARSHSRGRRDSYSRSPSPDRNKRSRSKSVSAMARKGLAALGIGAGAGAAANEVGRNRDRSRSRNRDDYDDYSDYDDRSRRTRGQRGDVYGNPRYSESRGSVDSRGGARARDGQRNKKVAEGKNGYASDDSLISSSEDERRVKKMKARSHRH